ncbi:CaiB/BaiF CoA-transferase family protein [Variovorax sp. Sphag1AA]|uniref:CaiB/BaiF CoA transferase family protein n=1 Tax=Variovorax sp. Sphag1AA TaxID=2587027 RepID=UPI0016193634|nr:CoA transferase [Variovorax sp. Sphag1AA]MBB3180458.1 crotonobetainyl-CoA:carnitine CoA-transferase CaiB-like acyl-CoA transferase [Variovorax sp. Sphag1AA]
MSKPLEGVRVIDMSHVIAGPLASLYLAQLGAEVIKIEPLQGEVMRASKASGEEGDTPAGFAALNAGKRSFATDIRTPEGAELVRSLARTADVFIENFRPGVVAKYGLDYASIRAVRPDIVYCSISGYGQEGEWSRRGAYDHVMQALTGMMMMQGDGADTPPMKVGFPVIDVAVGMLGALSIVASLHRRARDGEGQHIDASMVQASLMLMYPNASSFLSNRVEPQRVGNRGYTGSPTADTYRCADGWLATAANTPAQFRKLTAVVGLEELCNDAEALDLDAFNAPGGGFVVARKLAYVQQCFREAFAARSAGEMEERLNAVGVPAARVRKLGEFLDEVETTGDRIGMQPVTFPQGSIKVRTPGIGFRCRFDGGPSEVGAPSLASDNMALLSELGMADDGNRPLCDARATR